MTTLVFSQSWVTCFFDFLWHSLSTDEWHLYGTSRDLVGWWNSPHSQTEPRCSSPLPTAFWYLPKHWSADQSAPNLKSGVKISGKHRKHPVKRVGEWCNTMKKIWKIMEKYGKWWKLMVRIHLKPQGHPKYGHSWCRVNWFLPRYFPSLARTLRAS